MNFFVAAAGQPLAAHKKIFREAFGDEGAAVDRYFELFTAGGNELLYAADGARESAPIAMLFLLPCAVVTASGSFPARYLFAACTHRAQRGRGAMTELLHFADRRAIETGARYIVLAPAGESLFRYYADRGYTAALARCRAEVAAAGAPTGIGTAPIGADTLPALFRTVYAGLTPRLVPSLAMAIATAEGAAAAGGGVLGLTRGDRPVGYAVFEPGDGGELRVTELCCPPAEAAEAAEAVLRHLGLGSALFTSPMPLFPGSSPVPTGMARIPTGEALDFSGGAIHMILD